MIVDLVHFMPLSTGNFDLSIKTNGEKIVIESVPNPRLPKQNMPHPLTLNRFIKFDKNFFEVIGMYFGDGLKSTSGSGNRQIYFSNTEWKLHEKWIKFLAVFSIEKKQLHYQIQIGEKNKYDEMMVKQYWAKKANLKPSYFKIYTKRGKKTDPNGILLVCFYSRIFSLIFRKIYNLCLNILSKPQYIVPFLRGLFAAEGRVAISKNHIIQYLDISSSKDEKREVIQNLLKKIDIKSKNNKNKLSVDITGYFNFLKFKKLNLHLIHPKKREKFNYGFKNVNKHVPGLLKLQIIKELQKGTTPSRFDLARILKRNVSTIRYNLKDLEVKDIVTKRRRGLRCIWSLNRHPIDLKELTTQSYR